MPPIDGLGDGPNVSLNSSHARDDISALTRRSYAVAAIPLAQSSVLSSAFLVPAAAAN